MAVRQRYRIRSYAEDFFSGRDSNGEQVLMGLMCPYVALYRFDYVGKYLGRELRPWLFAAKKTGGIYAIYDIEFQEKMRDQLSQWQSEINFTERPIEIEEFFDVEQSVGIELSDECNCAFVFFWGKDYWMNESGEVEST